MPSVLFVCTANRFRSPLAAAFFQQMLGDSDRALPWSVDSAGTWTSSGLQVLPAVLLIARKYGLDLSQHRSKLVSASLLLTQDLVLVMEAGHKEALQHEFPMIDDRVYLFSQATEGCFYDIPDPIESIEAMMEVGENIHDLVQTGFGNIYALAIHLQTTRQN